MRMPNRAGSALSHPDREDYYLVQVPPEDGRRLNGYIVAEEHLKDTIALLTSQEVSRIVVWRLTPVLQYKRYVNGGGYFVRRFGEEIVARGDPDGQANI